jgi:quercetin dioxygenase-like cupin family protein
MSSLDRSLAGDALVRHLTQEQQAIDRALLAKHGRTARTLVKEGPLRLTLIAIAPGGDLPEHDADGPISVQVIDGRIDFAAAGHRHALGAGDVLVIGAGVRHAARSDEGGTFLLTVVHLPSVGSAAAPRD